MAVLMTSDIAGQTLAGYDVMLQLVAPALRTAEGLLLHASHPVDGGWRVVEVWDTREDATRFYASTIAPHLPDHLRPKMTFSPLHDVLRP